MDAAKKAWPQSLRFCVEVAERALRILRYMARPVHTFIRKHDAMKGLVD